MSSENTTAAGKRRVRTGCLTCRKRRRKCDERKPRCENCEIKDLSCEYGTKLTFVSTSSANAQQSHKRHPSLRSYSKIKFVNEDGSTPARPTPDDEHNRDEQPATESLANEPQNEQIALAEQGLSSESSVPIDSPRRNDEHIRTETRSQENVSHSRTRHNRYSHSTFGSIDFGISSLVGEQAIQSPLGQRSLASFYGDITSLPTSFQQTLPVPESYQASQEFNLLRQYRYEIAPWLDIGDPNSCFGITVLLAAKDSESLQNAVLALASRREALLREDDLSMGRSSHYRQMADGMLGSEKGCVRRVSTLLLWVGDILASQPRSWKSLAFQDSTLMDRPITDHLQQQMEDAMFWLRLRIDIAATVAAAQPPLSLAIRCLPDQVLNGLTKQGRSPTQIFRRALLLLASTLVLIFDDGQTGGKYSSGEASVSTAFMTPSARWTSLWQDAQIWLADRPVEVKQVYEARGMQVDAMDLQNWSSFPIIVFSSSLALVANAANHITSLLLLTNRPRLLKPAANPGSSTSPIWHAQTIAGIACSSNSSDWDPVLITGLLLAAKSMTHESQQTAVLETIERITSDTGIRLDEEVQVLKANWNVARSK